ncbi:MAG: hypothetical protein KGZ79_00430 [Dethiobacter sp.]|nr:hypothetical protein [Dethiobacter sp.]
MMKSSFALKPRGSSSLEEVHCEPNRCPWWINELEQYFLRSHSPPLSKA